jgi:hypothetical protein
MKRTTLKLRRETLRVLAGMELVRAAGGGNPDAQLFDSAGAGTGCPNAQLVDSGNAGTGCPNVGAALPVKP